MTELGYKTLRERIVDIIRKRIINRELQPGQKIVEQELAKEFKTSRAPIREALRELENEGLVEYVRNAGCSVKEITFEESFEIYLMRANYEIMAVRLLGGKIPEETLQEMEEILERIQLFYDIHLVTCGVVFLLWSAKRLRIPRYRAGYSGCDSSCTGDGTRKDPVYAFGTGG